MCHNTPQYRTFQHFWLRYDGDKLLLEREDIWTLDAKGEFMITLLTSLAQEESRSLSENVTWGKRKLFADGKYSLTYSRFLGYDKGFVINEEEALVVRLIYRMSLQGYSAYAIADKLSKWQIKTPQSKGRWHGSVVGSILRNEKYKGDALLQKYYTKDFLTHRQVENKGEFPQYYVADGHEPIIAREVFDYAQSQKTALDDRSCVKIWAVPFVCGICGSRYGAKLEHSNNKYRRNVYMCRRRFKKPYYCKNTRIDEALFPHIYQAVARKICNRYPQIMETCLELLAGIGSVAVPEIGEAYRYDVEDLTMIIKEIRVFPKGKLKLLFVDGTSNQMTIRKE